jgi:serine/threonine protein kinase
LATLSPRANDDRGQFHDAGVNGEPFVGTPAYAPPEAFLGGRSWQNGDRWALAVVMLEAASGISPFAAACPGAHCAATRVADLCSRCLQSTPGLRVFLERALAPSPGDRFQTSDDFLAALEEIADALRQ